MLARSSSPVSAIRRRTKCAMPARTSKELCSRAQHLDMRLWISMRGMSSQQETLKKHFLNDLPLSGSACVAALCWGTDDAARMHGRAQANYSLHVTVTTNGIRFVTGRPKSCQSGAHEEHPLSVDLCFSLGRLTYWSEFRNEPLGRENLWQGGLKFLHLI